MSPEEVAVALADSNRISPSGNMPLGDKYPVVPVNSVVKEVEELESVPIRREAGHTIYLRDVGRVRDYMDLPAGYALVNGRRAVYILATKRADASTLSVVNEIKAALPDMQAALPDDVRVSFEFDQTPYVTRGAAGVIAEGTLGALLVGLMILWFLRDWRSALVVVLNIPLALMAAIIALWLTGQTLNLMTLGGLALAIGILVDEATVAIENIHSHLERGRPLARAVRDGAAETIIPRFLAMVCILAVFISAFFMRGAARSLFVPLALAVGFSMVASYILSSTFVPVMSIWLLRGHAEQARHHARFLDWLRAGYTSVLRLVLRWRAAVIAAYLVASLVLIAGIGTRLGLDIFPRVGANQFRIRLRAADGTHLGRTEQITLHVIRRIEELAGRDQLNLTLAYVGTNPSSYPINAVYHWSRGPEEAVLWIDFKPEAAIDVAAFQEKLRQEFGSDPELESVRFSFEPSDIVNEVMSFGATSPIEVAVIGPNLAENRAYAEKLYAELSRIGALRDLQFAQSLDYPTVEVHVDRQRAGLAGVTPKDVANALVAATSSTRFTVPIFWADSKSGRGYQVQIEMPRAVVRPQEAMESIDSVEELEALPVLHPRTPASDGAGNGRANSSPTIRIRDVAHIKHGTMPGQLDRYNMQREIGLTANIVGTDLGSVARQVMAALERAGQPPRGVKVELRGQIPPMREILTGLGTGLLLAIVVIFLLLAANFQSLRLALVTISTAPAVVGGVVIMLFLTGTTINLQSFIGSIMAVGVAMANAILLVTFAENNRRHGMEAVQAAVEAAAARLRAVLMTTSAMIAGMLPMALAFGEAGAQNAPLGRAVIGGLAAATFATFFLLPCVFASVQKAAPTSSGSLDPDDPTSTYFDSTQTPTPLVPSGGTV
ncbi:MAG: RND transporter [Pirellulaceae bacterium]|nr:MAG: RND transporter [Pirellulaceae bacterium]